MHHTVACHLEADLAGHADIVLSVAVASSATIATESLNVTLNGGAVSVLEIADEHGTRLHRAKGLGAGRLVVQYDATVTDRAAAPASADIDVLRYARPSRYCEADQIAAFARAEFDGLHGRTLLDAVTTWVNNHVNYAVGSSRPTDGAVATLLSRQGVCRDFAHLVIAILRSCDMPARLVSVYAPGLYPMDFHAVAEAYVEDGWFVVDATSLAPRSTLLRIATGRDSADTAFLTVAGDAVTLAWLAVSAYTEGQLPIDDRTQLVQIG